MEEARVGMLRWRKEGLVCGFIRRARGSACAVMCVESSAAMVWSSSSRAGRAMGVGERRERVRRIINSVRAAGSGTSAAGVECLDVFVEGGAGEVRGMFSSAVRRILVRVAFRRRTLSSCVYH